jgi:tetratricopeptide (TPR) repeat protein
MARRTLLPLAAVLLTALLTGRAAAQGNPSPALENKIKIQMAMMQADEYRRQNQPAKAVEALEDKLALIDGDRKYLMRLLDAYRDYVIHLKHLGQDAQARKYLDLLAILDGNAAKDPALQPAAAPATPKMPTTVELAAGSPRPQDPPQVTDNGQLKPKARGVMAEPFDLANRRPPEAGTQALTLLAQAEAAFKQERYTRARNLFEQAHQADPQCTAGCRDRWAYSKLSYVVEAVNQPSGPVCAWEQLEAEVHAALALAPHLKGSGDALLSEIGKRRGKTAGAAAVAVKHLSGNAQGWQVAESQYFRVLHKQTPEVAEKVARVAEATRAEMTRKWFADQCEDWTTKCDIYVYNTAAEYQQQNPKVAPGTPGHSHIETDRKTFQVVLRRLHLHCESFNWLETVLPHETTHVVIAGQFGTPQVPRWADEGMAVLAEPAGVLEKHRGNLLKCLKPGGGSFPVSDLMQMPNYPTAERVSAFYAQSVALVDYLAKQKGPVVFSRFLRDAGQKGYEAALAQHYGFQGFADLQNRWVQHVQASLTPQTYAGKGP